jgi:uncharacterized protein YkwD
MKTGLRKGMMLLAAVLAGVSVLPGVVEAKRKPPVSKPVVAAKAAKKIAVVQAAPPLPIAIPTASALPANLNQRLLAAHNRERASLGMTALIWSEALSKDAAVWAKHLADTDTFDHAPSGTGKDDQGENLWMGTRGAYSAEDMVGTWIAEKSLFKNGRFPNVSTTGNWADVGHYTQLIWHNTSAVGCSVVANRKDEYLVCRYGPPGNWMDQDPFGGQKRSLKTNALGK